MAGASPLTSVTAGLTPIQSPTLPSRATVAAQASVEMTALTKTNVISRVDAWRRRRSATVTATSNAMSAASPFDNGTGSDAGMATAFATLIRKLPVASCCPSALRLTANAFIVPPGGKLVSGTENSMAALPLVPLPSPALQPPASYVVAAVSAPPTQVCCSSRATVAVAVVVVTTAVLTRSTPTNDPSAVVTTQPVAAALSVSSSSENLCSAAWLIGTANASAQSSALAQAERRKKNSDMSHPTIFVAALGWVADV